MSEAFPCNAAGLRLPGPAGVLEALTTCPTAAPALCATAVICHPHPRHGGTMHNKVVHTVARALTELGLRTVRFNFRGVGQSAGEFARGVGETDDLLAVLGWVRAYRPHDELWLAGFSFGAYVAVRAAARAPVARLITIAPPVQLYDFAALPTPTVPWLVVHGEDDEVVAVEQVRADAEARTPRPQLVLLPHTTHFFHRRLHELRAVLAQALAGAPPPS